MRPEAGQRETTSKEGGSLLGPLPERFLWALRSFSALRSELACFLVAVAASEASKRLVELANFQEQSARSFFEEPQEGARGNSIAQHANNANKLK